MTISQPAALAYIDEPDGRSVTARGPTLIRGWALGVASPVSRVEVSLDGEAPARAGLYRYRPDLAGAAACARIARALQDLAIGGTPGVAAEDAALSGFEFRTDTRRLDAGRDRVLLTVDVTLLDGTGVHLGPVEMTLAPASQAPAGDAMPQDTQCGTQSLPARRSAIEGRIRLLCVARSLDRGGSQLQMKELIGHLASQRFETVVVAPVEGPLRAELEAIGALVHVAPMPVDDIAAYGQALETVTAWAAARFDLVLAFTLTSFFGVDLADRLALPSVWRIGENEPVTTVLQWMGTTIDPQVELRAQRAFATASVVLCVSDSTLRMHRRERLGRFAVLRNAVDVAAARAAVQANDRRACRASLGIDPDRRVLVCAGTLWPVKGQALLISALAHVRADHPELECVIVGQHVDPYATVLPRLIERKGLADVVRLVPFTDDLSRWWCAADVALCPSESEGLSTSVLEAMAFGLPVLASRVAGLPEVVEDGVTGWLCEPSDLASLIAALKRVARAETAELRRLGQAAMACVAQGHERSQALARMTDLLEQVACGGRPAWLEQQVAERGVVAFLKRSWRRVIVGLAGRQS